VREGEQVVVVAPAVLGASTTGNDNARYDKDKQVASQQSDEEDSKSWWRAIFGN
jgi:hypothetical protein